MGLVIKKSLGNVISLHIAARMEVKLQTIIIMTQFHVQT